MSDYLRREQEEKKSPVKCEEKRCVQPSPCCHHLKMSKLFSWILTQAVKAVEWIPLWCRREGWRNKAGQWLPPPSWCEGSTHWRKWQRRGWQWQWRWDNDRGWEEPLCILPVEHPGDRGVETMWWRARAVIAEAEENQRPPLIGINKNLIRWWKLGRVFLEEEGKHLKERLKTRWESGWVCLPRNSGIPQRVPANFHPKYSEFLPFACCVLKVVLVSTVWDARKQASQIGLCLCNVVSESFM